MVRSALALALALALSMLAAAGCLPRRSSPTGATQPSVIRGIVGSNILRRDYVGSAVCESCHPSLYESFMRSPMHRMTRLPEKAEIHAPFSGDAAVFRFKDDRVELSERGGARYMQIVSERSGTHRFRITKVIGGHYREDFAGVAVDEQDRVLGDPHQERVMPVSFMIGSGRFRYKGYSVMSPERPGLRPGGVWNRTCIFCHNTEPRLSTLLGALAGPEVGPYQGEVVDPLLPEARRRQLVVTDEKGLTRALADEVALLHGKPERADRPLAVEAARAVRATRAWFDQSHLVEVGIGCESCHNGAREHVKHPGVLPSFALRSPLLRARVPESRVEQINRTCAGCHQVLFSRYPFTWEGGLRGDHPGGSSINSGEARDFMLGACSSQMSCVTCHDPHAADDRAHLAELDGKKGNAVCLKCHAKYAGQAALRAHAHHDPDGPGGVCMNCHMPRKNMTLENRLGRYHRIGSPDDPIKVERDRPLECALCHVDRTVGELVTTMEKWWGRRYDRAALERLYGSLDANVMTSTVVRGKAHEQAVALYLLGQNRVRAAVPLIERQITHPYPILRYYALGALEAVVGRPSGIDLHQADAKIFADTERWLESVGLGGARTAPTAAASPSDERSGDED